MLASQGHLKYSNPFPSIRINQYASHVRGYICITEYQLFEHLDPTGFCLRDVSSFLACVCVCPDFLLSVSVSQIRILRGRWRGNRKEGLLWQQLRKRRGRLRHPSETEKVIKDLLLVFTSMFSM